MVSNLERKFQNEDFLLYRLPGVARRVSAICASEYYAEFGMKVPEWRLLAQIGRFGNISPKELSDKMSMDQVAVSRAIYKCLGRGFVREIANPLDRRSKVLTLTSQGRAFLTRFFPRACALAERMEQGLSAGEVETLKLLLNKLDRHLKTLTPLPIMAKKLK
jgi:DNA-binding MarR family transcriptional regulator